MSRLVPMPAFTDPNLPEAASGSVNFGIAANFAPFEAHPVKHAASYGGAGRERAQMSDTPAPGSDEPVNERDDWNKDKWVDLAREYGLSTSGTKDEVIAAVEEHEASLESERSDV